MNLVKGSLQDELDRFFQVLNDQPFESRELTKAAFCKARQKLSHSAFVELNQQLLQSFFEAHDDRRWLGFRVCAVDGTTLNLPRTEAMWQSFGGHSIGGQQLPMARASQLYDVLNHLTIDAQLSTYDIGERELAARHLDHTSTDDLVVYDRGYPAFWLFALHQVQHRHFCARVTVNLYNETRDFYYSEAKEQIVTLSPSRQAIKQCRKLGLPVEPINVRLVRVCLEGKEDEILITSLRDDKCWPAELFKELYHLRWGVEEDYKVMKSRLEVENFSGRSSCTIYQDFHAKVLSKNLTAVLAFSAQDLAEQRFAHRKHRYQVNFTQAISKMKGSIVQLLSQQDPLPCIRSLINIFSITVEAVRPGRHYSRKTSVSLCRRYHASYKPTR